MKIRVLFLGLFFFYGCHQNYEEGAHPPPIPPPQAASEMPANHPPVQADAAPVGDAIVSGTIQIAPDLVEKVPQQGILYIMVRPAPSGPPLAVKRLPVPSFPFAYTITQADAGMMPGQDVDLTGLDALYLFARIDLDGKVGPAEVGDMDGASPSNPIVPGDQQANILIDKVH